MEKVYLFNLKFVFAELQPYSAGIFHLPTGTEGATPSSPSPYSHFNPLLHSCHNLQQQQQLPNSSSSSRTMANRPLSAGSANQHIYMEVDPR